MSIIRDGFQSADLDVPVVSPTLNLDFANSQELDPRITFTRGSPATFVNKNGLIETVATNQPRFDYDPVTGECKGLLIEESRQNLISNSETSTGWNAGSASTSQNVITSPNGTQTANKLNVGSSTFLQITNSPSATVSSTHTFSVFLKAGELKYVQLRVRNAGNINNYFRVICNLTTGELTSGISNGTGTYTSASATKFPNDWWRFTVTGIADTSGTQLTALLIGQINASTVASVSNSSPTDGFYWWGAQLETGAFPTSYIPTSSSTVTRSADVASMTGTNFSSWYNQTEGTIYTNNRIPYTPNPNVSLFFTITNPSPFSRHSVEQTTANGLTYINQNGSGIQYWSTSGSGVFPANTNRKTTYSYSSSNNITILSGTSNQTYNFGQTSRTDVNKSMTGLYFGVFINSLYLNGTIARFTYYPKKLKDNQLLYLTQ